MMNRWRQRLGELHSEGGVEPRAAVPSCVRIVQNVQNPVPRTPFEHFERIEQPTKPPSAIVIEAVVAVLPPSGPSEAEAKPIAIVENDDDTPSKWAEGFARLDPEIPWADVPPVRWQRFIRDGRRFLDSRLCSLAGSLGWGPLDLFGCDQIRPFARIDQAGLIWLLNGDRLVLLSQSAAVIETRTEARQTYRLKPRAPGQVLAWELVS